MIPVVRVCRATLSDNERDAMAVLEPHFHTDDLQLHKVSTLLYKLECLSLETAWKCIHVPNPVPDLCIACVQAWTLLVHWSCLHAWALAWAHVYMHFQAVSKLEHSNFYSSGT